MVRHGLEQEPAAIKRTCAAFGLLAPFALGYFLSYLFRAVNAVVGPDLVAEIGLSAGQLGLLTSAYLLAFALFQLPLGVLLDLIGPRRVQAALLACAAAGALLFAMGQSIGTLTLARALIGFGFAGGLMSGFKAVVLWLPAERRALANATIMSFGALGILVATVPVDLSVAAIGWRGVFAALALLTLIAALLVLLAVPEMAGPRSAARLGTHLAAMAGILRDSAFWRLAPLVASTAGAHIAIQTLWAGPWFRDVAGQDRAGVARHLMLVAIAFFIGILLSGAVADWLVRRGVSILSVMLGFMGIYLFAEVAVILQLTEWVVPIWFLFGMFGQVAILAYPWLSTHYGTALSGRANTAMNLTIFSAAFVLQYAIGAVIDLFPVDAAGGYAPAGYQAGFGLCLVLQLTALGWYLGGRHRLASTPAS